MASTTHAAVVTAHRLKRQKSGGSSFSDPTTPPKPSHTQCWTDVAGRTQSTGSKCSKTESIKNRGKTHCSRASFLAGEKTLAVQKINDGNIDDLTLRDVQMLFEVMDPAKSGISFTEIRKFLGTVLDTACADQEMEALFNLIDLDDDGQISAEELFSSLTSGPVKRHLQQLQEEEQARRRFDEMTGRTAEVSRELLVDKIHWRVHRDDAFRTLPFSLCYILVFVFVVDNHLRIWDRHRMERGLEAWMSNFGKELAGPYLHATVAGVESLGSWLQSSGLTAVFGECTDNSAGEPWCRLGDRNILVGDVELQQRRKDGANPSEWLLRSSAEARAHLASGPRDFLGASSGRVKQLWDTGWADEETEEIKLSFSTYNRRQKMFAVTEVTTGFSHGFVAPTVVTSAVSVDPYPSKAILGLDALYCCFLVVPFVQETKDLITTCRLQGMGEGCRTYWGFWNFVDWLSILIGSTAVCVWCLCCVAMQGPAIQSLVGEDVKTHTLVTNVMYLDTQTLANVKEELGQLTWLFFCLHLLMAANIITIMLKFFKAFQANDRLKLVTNTFARAADDMFHWGIVFGAIFIGFALSGNILFGGDLLHFNSIGRSINTSFRTLMGEFDWYVEVVESDLGLGSGMPVEILGAWFWGFMVLVMLILLNMLLAIILEHYAKLVQDLRNEDVPSIFAQTWGYVQQRKKEKGFIPLSRVLALLEDQDEQAHDDPVVTADSLMKAFTMKDDQADVLMDWLNKEAVQQQQKAQGGTNIASARLEAVEGLVEAMFKQMRDMTLDVSTLASSIEGRHAAQKAEIAAIDDGSQKDTRLSSRGSTQGSDRQTPKHKSAWGQMLETSTMKHNQQLVKEKSALEDLTNLVSELRLVTSQSLLAKQACEQDRRPGRGHSQSRQSRSGSGGTSRATSAPPPMEGSRFGLLF